MSANGGLVAQGIVAVSLCYCVRTVDSQALGVCVYCKPNRASYAPQPSTVMSTAMRLLRIGSTPSPQLQRVQAIVGSDIAARVRRTTATSSERVTIVIINPSPSMNNTCRWPRCHLPTPRTVLRRHRRRRRRE